MNTSETDLELIERFISGKLSQTELEDFETRMEEDHEFARKLRLRKTFPSLFKAEGHDEIVMTPDSTPAEKPERKKRILQRTGISSGGGLFIPGDGRRVFPVHQDRPCTPGDDRGEKRCQNSCKNPGSETCRGTGASSHENG